MCPERSPQDGETLVENKDAQRRKEETEEGRTERRKGGSKGEREGGREGEGKEANFPTRTQSSQTSIEFPQSKNCSLEIDVREK